MGASNSTRRLIVEEDEKGGGFLIQVSDTVAKQIYGIKEKPKVTKSNDQLKRKVIVEDKRKTPAVEAPPEKPQLLVPSFPVIPATPILPPSPIIPIPGSPKIAPASTVAKTDLLPKEKEQKPVESKSKEEAPVLSSKVEKTPPKEPEKKAGISIIPVLSPKVEKPLEKKESVLTVPSPKLEKPTPKELEKKESVSATPVLSSEVEKTAPKEVTKKESISAVPVEKLAQKETEKKSIPAAPLPSTKVEKLPQKEIEKPVAALALAVMAEEKAVTAESKEKELIAMERKHIYKQMNEIYVEREKAFKSIEEFYQDKMQSLQHQSSKMNTATKQEFAKAVEEVENKFLKHVEAPVCEDLQLKVLECYRSNQSHPLNCSMEVHAFATAVDQARQNVILAKKV